ncbi:MAG: nodulation protein NfeD [Steroidobacteraceae bacterium]|jgi:membrane-bound serine protease (ClpP class)
MARWLWMSWAVTLCMISARVACAAATPAVADHLASTGMVAQLALDGPIGPAAAEYFDDAAKRAVADGAVAIVLRLDTPGGLSDSMRQIISGMLACKVPVLVYVAPGGARAASAGTYILYAGQIAAMAPATHVGAATPVSLGGSMPMPKIGDQPPSAASSPAPAPSADDGDAESHKILNDSIAYLRSLAQLRGRNVEWAEQAVRGAATLTASEAAQQHVIDFVATDVSDLLAKADGRMVQLGDRTVSLQLKGASVREYAPNARSRFLAIITNPTIAYLLLLAGIVGLFVEATHPGVLLPGIAGGICLLVGLYALQLLPVNYAGLALMALGIGLLAAEAVAPTVGAFGIGGVISFVVGSVMLMNTAVPGYGVNLGVIAGIAVSAAGLLALIVWLVFRARHSRQFTGDEALLNEVAELLEPMAVGGEAWASVHGERWRVRCESALPAGARARVVRREGLLLWVAPV